MGYDARARHDNAPKPGKQFGACGRSAERDAQTDFVSVSPQAISVYVRRHGSAALRNEDERDVSLPRTSHHDGRHQRQRARTWLGDLTLLGVTAGSASPRQHLVPDVIG